VGPDKAIRLVRGDRDAFAAIYDRYAGAVLDLCTAVLRDGEEAAESTLDSFLRAARELVNLRDRSRLRLWLLAVARHEATARAQLRRREGLPDLGRPQSAAGPGADDPQQFPWDPSAALSAKDRTILHLHLRHELEGAQLGTVLGVPADPSSCKQLTEVLRGWDGRFTPALGARVEWHVRRCDDCRGRRTMLLARLRAMASLPFVSPPPWLRREVLLRMELAVSARPLPSWEESGFPPGIGGELRGRRPRKGRTVAVAVAVVVLASAGGFLLLRDGGGGSTVTATGSPTTTPLAAPTTAGPPTSAPTAATAPLTSTTVSPTTNPGQANPGQANPGQANPGQGSPGPAGPDLTGLGVVTQPVTGDQEPPDIFFGADASFAYVFGCPYSATGVTAEVTDQSAVPFVTLSVRRPDGPEEVVAMSFDGARWRATMGNFGSAGQAVFWVEAVDSEGNRSRSGDQVLDVLTCG